MITDPIERISLALEVPAKFIKPVEGFPDYYVADSGHVVSLKGRDIRVLEPWATNSGHLQVDLYRRGDATTAYIHHLVMAAFGPEPDDPSQNCILHRNDDKRDNSSPNLYWGTMADDARDREKNQTHNRKAFTREDAERVKYLLTQMSPMQLSEYMGVTARHLGNIANGTSWRKAHAPTFEELALSPTPEEMDELRRNAPYTDEEVEFLKRIKFVVMPVNRVQINLEH